MADTQFTRINDKFALAYDRLQWVLQRHSLRKGEDDWKAIAFVRSNKFHLFSVMIREGVPKDDALDICENLPKTFTEFLALEGAKDDRSASGSVILKKDEPECRKGCPSPTNTAGPEQDGVPLESAE